MTDTNRSTSIEQWTSVQAYVLAVICLLVGIAGGWFIRGSQSPAAVAETANASALAPSASSPRWPATERPAIRVTAARPRARN